MIGQFVDTMILASTGIPSNCKAQGKRRILVEFNSSNLFILK